MSLTNPNAGNQPPGWYPDPNPAGAGGSRWWDGNAWTAQTAPAPNPSPSTFGSPSTFRPGVVAPAPRPAHASGRRAAVGNQLSFITFAICAAYVVIAMEVHIVFLGILPIVMGFRAVGRKEALGIPAVIAAFGVAIWGFSQLG